MNDTNNSEENKKKIAEAVAKAWADPAFKQKLVSDPKNSLKEMGVTLPDNVNVKVCENTADTFHFVLPPKPEGNLSEEELKKMSGGTTIVFVCL